MNRILFVINGLGGGGSQKNVATLANSFAEKGCAVDIAVLLDDCPPFFKLHKNIIIHNLVRSSFSRKKYYYYWVRSLRKLIRENKITTIIAVGYRFGFLCALAKKKHSKLIIRSTITRKLNKTDVFLFRFLRYKIDTIIAQTESQKKGYPTFLQNKIITIPNPFDTFLENKNKDGFHSKRIICIGRYYLPQKRQDLIIKSISSFLKKEGYFLELYGEPQINDGGVTIALLKELIKKEKLEEFVFLKEPDKEIWNKVLPCFAFICSSSIEGMPNALIEGMSRGVVPISSNWDGSNEVITNGYTGFVASDLNSLSFFTEVLLKLKSDQNLYNTISNNCWKAVRKKYDSKQIIETWSNLIDCDF